MRPKPPPNAIATTRRAIVPAAKETAAAGIGPMSRPSAELIGACMAKPAPTASVSKIAVPRSTTPTLQAPPRSNPATPQPSAVDVGRRSKPHRGAAPTGAVPRAATGRRAAGRLLLRQQADQRVVLGHADLR